MTFEIRGPIYGGELIEVEGFRFRIELEQDEFMGPPWEEHDGHGIVSEWTQRDKRPGEWVLNKDRFSKRYYDFAGTMKKAKKEGWGLTEKAKAELIERLSRKRIIRLRKPIEKFVGPLVNPIRYISVQERPGRDPNKSLTRGEITEEAVRRDYEHLRGWCNDEWQWQYVSVIRLEDEDGSEEEHEDGTSFSLGGVENSDDDYVKEIVYELLDEALHVLKKERNERQYWAERDVETV